jgi:hypothetical protein
MIRERNSSETTVGLFITLETVADDTPAKRATSRKVTPEVRERFAAAWGSAASADISLLFAMRGDGRIRARSSIISTPFLVTPPLSEDFARLESLPRRCFLTMSGPRTEWAVHLQCKELLLSIMYVVDLLILGTLDMKRP